jgi:hypothetical protein
MKRPHSRSLIINLSPIVIVAYTIIAASELIFPQQAIAENFSRKTTNPICRLFPILPWCKKPTPAGGPGRRLISASRDRDSK